MRSPGRALGIVLLLAVHGLATAWVLQQRYALPTVPVGAAVPGLDAGAPPLRGVAGEPVRVPRPGAVVFWASWCRACSRAMGAWARALQATADLPIVAVNMAEDRAVATRYLSRMGYAGAWARADEPAPTRLGVETIPLTVLLGARGELVAAFRHTERARMEAILQWLRASR